MRCGKKVTKEAQPAAAAKRCLATLTPHASVGWFRSALQKVGRLHYDDLQPVFMLRPDAKITSADDVTCMIALREKAASAIGGVNRFNMDTTESVAR